MWTFAWMAVMCVAAVSAGVDQICGRQELTETRECTSTDGGDDCCCYLNRCTYFEPAERIDCGFEGITRQACEAKSCCYSQIPRVGANFCWYPVCTKTNMDVCFLVDTSGSILQVALNNVMALVQGVANELTLGENAIRTCIIPFKGGNNPTPDPPLAGNNPLDVSGFVATGGTNVQGALNVMANEFAASGLDGNCQVGVVLTDGVFFDNLTPPSGVTIVAVGVTSNSELYEQMLMDLATGSDRTNVLISEKSDGSDLAGNEKIQALRHLICCPDP